MSFIAKHTASGLNALKRGLISTTLRQSQKSNNFQIRTISSLSKKKDVVVTPAACSVSLYRTKRCFATQTDGDRDLAVFLKEEIAYEEDNVVDLPQFKDFKVEMDKTLVSLKRKLNGESIVVSFDVNDNVNVDEEGAIDEDQYSEEDAHIPDIISYPSFNVKIVKASGETIHFNCTCSTDAAEDENNEELDAADEQFDIFRFENVKIYNESDVENIFEAETETMDGELYSMLMTMLLERGITGNFVNDLLDLSTTVEHRHYLTFLKSLNKFVNEK